MRANNVIRNTFLVLTLSTPLAACGGGGGGGSSSSGSVPSGAGAAPAGQHAGPTGAGTALVTWDAPSTKVDGSCMSDLASYRISYGLAPSVYDSEQTVEASNLSCVDTGKTDACGQVRSCTYMVDNLGSASWYFAVQAIDTAGNESEFSNEAIKTIQ